MYGEKLNDYEGEATTGVTQGLHGARLTYPNGESNEKNMDMRSKLGLQRGSRNANVITIVRSA